MGPEESEAAVALQGPRGDPRSGLSKRNLAVMESLGGSPVFAGNRSNPAQRWRRDFSGDAHGHRQRQGPREPGNIYHRR